MASEEFKYYLKFRYDNEWPSDYEAEASKAHNKNVAMCQKAIEEYEEKERPIRILMIHGSGRHTETSCAHEISNSKMLAEYGLDAIRNENDVEVDSIDLSATKLIERCNGCVSTCSSLCAFTCDCHPFDGMQELYPKFLRSDIYFFSTGVYQDTMHGLLTNVCQRLISMDGGFLRDKYRLKTSEFKQTCIKISKDNDFEYNARLYGRVCGYFISSKDHENPSDTAEGISYIEDVASQLKNGFEAYDCQHAKPWYAGAVSKWDEEYSYDKARLQENTVAQEKAQKVAVNALKLIRDQRKDPKLKPKPTPGRINRT